MSLTEEDKRWISDQLEAMETRLLTAFHKWSSPMDARVRSHTAALRAVDLELEQLRDKLEGGKTQ